MANLDMLRRYKATLMEAICTSDSIVNLLKTANESSMTGRDMMYKRVFPYAHIPMANEEAEAFIGFDVDVTDGNDIINGMIIHIYMLSHENIMRLTDSQGMRVDALADEIDKFMNGSNNYGLGKVRLKRSTPFSSADGYYGRESIYTVNDITRNLCGGGNS